RGDDAPPLRRGRLALEHEPIIGRERGREPWRPAGTGGEEADHGADDRARQVIVGAVEAARVLQDERRPALGTGGGIADRGRASDRVAEQDRSADVAGVEHAAEQTGAGWRGAGETSP